MKRSSHPAVPPIYLGAWLEFCGIKVGEAAVIAGCDQSYISNIIANKKPNINVLYLLRLSEKMEITINDLYRPAPSKSQLAHLREHSEQAKAAILKRVRRKA